MTNRLPQIESRRLYRQIAELILRHIDSGQFPPGSLLPAERELAEQLGVSRASVREALIALEVEGRVSVKVGNGVTVLDKPATTAATLLADASQQNGWTDVGPLELLEARILVECETAALAAKRATQPDIDILEAMLGEIADEHRRLHHIQPADRRFHMKIAEMSGNQALVHLIAQLWDQRASPVFARFEDHFVTQRLFEDTSQDHRRILDAIIQRDSTAARTAMRRHLSDVRKAFLRGLSGVPGQGTVDADD
ncbi:DNA-binding FadR family transcriptional regulator [Silvimonas terrae]|uniref:DNA-binding FadR family transcriptional regulator n=1 Tax=Silvimonas terrae TaxID=300266 RepID=A0A840R8Y9_9NEIS|nr:FadR/GntR family transcriptional regulator [Silvimonas terrae]MBB5189805.1 DNA-binding FadR family transcriptional regulator [Silvimonas terrae]